MNSASVDLIYLDPPFNSKANYAAPIGSAAAGAAFKDTWTLSDVDVEWINLIEAKHPALYRVLLAAMTDSDKSYLAYMAARLLEMHRLLKPTGSIYLHCDPTMSHYLKLVMDAIFDLANFRNEVIWKRTSAHNSARRYGPVHDTLLFYTAANLYNWNRTYQPYDPQYVENNYKHSDHDGRKYTIGDLTGAGTRDGESGEPWRECDPTEKGRHWALPRSFPGSETMPLSVREGLDYLDSIDRIYWPKGGLGVPRFKRYLDDMEGMPAQDIITDISPVSSRGGERLGYPTQKPLALLTRIIQASSNAGDVVLDPFCGCATACIAAEIEQRAWVGIDISPKAAELVTARMESELGMFFRGAHRTDLPRRTDLGNVLPYNDARNKRHLYGEQGGDCAGCDTHFELRNLEVDHIIPRAKGGTDHVENLQLLCGYCNRVKGDRGMDYLRAKLQIAA